MQILKENYELDQYTSDKNVNIILRTASWAPATSN